MSRPCDPPPTTGDTGNHRSLKQYCPYHVMHRGSLRVTICVHMHSTIDLTIYSIIYL